MPTREDAWELLNEYTENQNLVRHFARGVDTAANVRFLVLAGNDDRQFLAHLPGPRPCQPAWRQLSASPWPVPFGGKGTTSGAPFCAPIDSTILVVEIPSTAPVTRI